MSSLSSAQTYIAPPTLESGHPNIVRNLFGKQQPKTLEIGHMSRGSTEPGGFPPTESIIYLIEV